MRFKYEKTTIETDLKIKDKYFKKFCKDVKNGNLKTKQHYYAWVAWTNWVNHCFIEDKKCDWELFEKICSDRLLLGSKQYMADWIRKDCDKEAIYELIDLFNYPFLSWLKRLNDKNKLVI